MLVILIVWIIFICLEQKTNLNKKACENKDFCGVIMASEDTRILEFNHYLKSDKTLSIIYADLESLIKRIDRCKDNSEKSSTTKVG